MTSRLAFKLAGGLVATTGVGAFSFNEYMKREVGPEAVPRMLTAYRVSIPGFLAYKQVQFFHEILPLKLGRQVDEADVSARYEALHRIWAPRMLEVVLKLRGFNLKSAQMVASNFGGAFPVYWQKAFEPLLDDVPCRTYEQVKIIVEGELGKPLEEVYSSFDPVPLAAASIGQVHRAIMKGSGTRVVVKVQYPEVEGQFRGDVMALKVFLRFALPEYLAPIKEIEKQFANEFDYRREASQLASVGNNLSHPHAFPHIAVPKPLLPYCTKSVLTMTEIPNVQKLTTALETDMTAFAKEKGVPLQQLIDEEEALNEASLRKGVLRVGPDAATMDKYITLKRWKNFLGRFVGIKPSHIPLNHAALVDELFKVHGHEALHDGEINGDPHPGNLLVRRDASGHLIQLALVDYGQVKVLSPDHRLRLSRLMVALATANESDTKHRHRVSELLKSMGMETEKNDPEVLFKLAQLYFDRDDKLVTCGKHTQAYVEELQAADPIKSLGDDFVLVSRASLMLRGLGHMLNHHRSVAKAWLPFAEKVLRANNEDPAQIFAGDYKIPPPEKK